MVDRPPRVRASHADCGGTQIALPIYIEDSHAGSFYWLARHLDLEEPCMLLHFDAHSDASAIFDSDAIRQRIRRVPSKTERAQLLEKWRKAGTVQCFNWIEPLMPSPIAEVIWVLPDTISRSERVKREREATNHLDGHLEAAPRVAGSFAGRYRALALSELEAGTTSATPIVATIDLDYFSDLPPNERAAEFERVWKFVAERPNLRAITIAISRPYLVDDDEADALLTLALRAALSLPTARIEFAPFRTVANDQSLRAREFRAQNRAVPAFDLTKCSPALCALLLGQSAHIAVRDDAARWEAMLQEWRESAPDFRLSIKGHQPSTDDVWRIATNESAAEIEITADGWTESLRGGVQWIAEVPQYLRCNLTADGSGRAIFARDAPPRPRWREVIIKSSTGKLPLTALGSFFDQKSGCGALRIKARIDTGQCIRETSTIEIRRFAGTGFRAALTEQFGLPYLFGSGSLRAGGETGPETNWGADCANFLIYALRRQGLTIPWSNPKQFRGYLESSGTNFTEEELERGIFLHLGSHVAALMEDHPPIGELNGDDIVAHQLEGVPELLSVDQLLRLRSVSRFDLLRVPAPVQETDLLIGGDVMLGRSVGDQLEAGVDPFAGIRTVLGRGRFCAVNLECVGSPDGVAARGKKFHLRAAPQAPAALAAAGINLVSVANNHADDFGPEALRDSIRRLHSVGVKAIGASPDAAPFAFFEAGEARVALLAINDTDPLPLDRGAITQEIEKARESADFVVALVHWGEENTSRVTERQRELARWLIDSGVDLIAGSHPHCIQPLDFYRGRGVVYSLGNLVFDGAPRLASWNSGNLLEIGFEKRGASPSLRFTPVKLDPKGLPHLVPVPAAPSALTRN